MKKHLYFFFLLLMATLPAVSRCDAVEVDPLFPQITLSASATIHRPADELQMTLGVIEMGTEAEAVLAANSEKMQAIIANLKSIGLTKADYQTGQFSIHPTYTPYPKDPSPQWKPSINGYEVRNSIAIKTTQIDLAGKIIDAANRAGANNVENIHFTLSDKRSYWHEALSLATSYAINDAQVIAQAAQVKLGRLVSVSLDNTNSVHPNVGNIYFAKAAYQETTTPIESGNVSLTAQVSITYEIDGKP